MNVQNWKSTEFRRRMVQQLTEIVNAHPHYSPNASPVQLESAAFNRSSTQEEYIKNVRSVILMIKQQQQQRQVQQQQQQQQQQHGSIAHQYREHQIQSMRQQIMDQQHSMNAPSYPAMMPQQPVQQQQQQQQQQHQQQPQTQIDSGTRSFITLDHPPQQQIYDGGRRKMAPTSFANAPHPAMAYATSGPPANVTITAVSSSLPSSLLTSGLSFSVAPQPTAVDGSTVTAHYGPSGQQRPPYNVQNYPTSTTPTSLPPNSQGHMEPSMSLFSQPSPGSPATSAEEEQQYIQKKHELSQYIPTVMKVINKYTSRGTPEDAQRLQQVAKLRDFVKMLQDNTRRIPLSALAKWEVALKKIFPSANLESSVTSDSIVSGSAPSSMHPPSSQPTSLVSQVSSTHTTSSRAPQLELQSINSPTLSYSTPTIRENQLALQLMCKQHEKNNATSGVKSLPLLQRELEHLEDYFMYKQEIDSNENCIVLTCSLVNDYLAMDIPPLVLRIPDSYPNVPPEYAMNGYQNSSLLLNIEKHVGNQLTSMNLYSVTQLLHVWESSVRTAVKDIVALA